MNVENDDHKLILLTLYGNRVNDRNSDQLGITAALRNDPMALS